MPTGLGHTASKKEEVDRTKTGGQQGKVYLVIVQSTQRGGGPGGLPPEFPSVRVFMSFFVELSYAIRVC